MVLTDHLPGRPDGPAGLADLLGGPLADDATLVQDNDRVRQAAHEVDVVLDDQHRRRTDGGSQDLLRPGALLAAHTRRRLVQEQEAGLLAERHRDLQPLLLAVRQGRRHRITSADKADGLDDRLGRLTLRLETATEPSGDPHVR